MYIKLRFLVVLAILTQTNAAVAGLITVGFEGNISFVESGLSADFSLGESVYGHYAYETLNPTSVLSNDEIARYHVLTDFQISIGSNSWSSMDDGYIQVRDRHASVPRQTVCNL